MNFQLKLSNECAILQCCIFYDCHSSKEIKHNISFPCAHFVLKFQSQVFSLIVKVVHNTLYNTGIMPFIYITNLCINKCVPKFLQSCLNKYMYNVNVSVVNTLYTQIRMYHSRWNNFCLVTEFNGR